MIAALQERPVGSADAVEFEWAAEFELEGEGDDAEVSSVKAPSGLWDCLLAFPSEAEASFDPKPTGKVAIGRPEETALLAFCSEDTKKRLPAVLLIDRPLVAFAAEATSEGARATNLYPAPSILILEPVPESSPVEDLPRSPVARPPLRKARRRRLRIATLGLAARARAAAVYVFAAGWCHARYSTARSLVRTVRQRCYLALATVSRLCRETAEAIRHRILATRTAVTTAVVSGTTTISRLRRETAEAIRHRILAARTAVIIAVVSGTNKCRVYFAAICRHGHNSYERGIRSLVACAMWVRDGLITCYSYGRSQIPLLRSATLVSLDVSGAVALICGVSLGVAAVMPTMPRMPSAQILAMRYAPTTAIYQHDVAQPLAKAPDALTPLPVSESSTAASVAAVLPPADVSISKRDVSGTASIAPRWLPAVASDGRSANMRLRPAPAAAAPQTPSVYRGLLAVSSAPEGASVFVNGVSVGTTPLLLHDLPVGSRVLRMELDGHERWSASVRVVANEETRITARLRPLSNR